jgi:hypothetical protein
LHPSGLCLAALLKCREGRLRLAVVVVVVVVVAIFTAVLLWLCTGLIEKHPTSLKCYTWRSQPCPVLPCPASNSSRDRILKLTCLPPHHSPHPRTSGL